MLSEPRVILEVLSEMRREKRGAFRMSSNIMGALRNEKVLSESRGILEVLSEIKMCLQK